MPKISEMTEDTGGVKPETLLAIVEDGANKSCQRREIIQFKTATGLTGAANDLPADHAWRAIGISHTGTTTLTVEADLAGYEVDDEVLISWDGGDEAGQVVVAEGAGVSVETNESYALRKPGSEAILRYKGSNNWKLVGDLELV